MTRQAHIVTFCKLFHWLMFDDDDANPTMMTTNMSLSMNSVRNFRFIASFHFSFSLNNIAKCTEMCDLLHGTTIKSLKKNRYLNKFFIYKKILGDQI